MHYVVAGVGYTGLRVWRRLPADRRLGIRRPGTPGDWLGFDGDESAPGTISCPEPHALLYTVPPTPYGDEDLRLERFLAALRTAPVRFVYLSTSGVYGDRGGAPTDETAAPAPSTDRARRRLHAEAAIAAWCDDRGVEPTVLRVPGIYGPGRLGLDRLRRREPVLREADANPGNRIHVDDLALACLAALQHDAPTGIYNVSDGDHRSSTAFSKDVAAQAGLPAPPEIPREEANRRFSAARRSFLNESRVLDTRKMRDVLGVTPRYADSTEGIAASLAEEVG